MDEYLDNLQENNFLDISNCNKDEIIELCLKYVDRLFKKYINNGKSVYTAIPCRYKNSDYISCSILFYVLEIHYEMDSSKVTQKRYREIFNEKIHGSCFYETLKLLRERIIKIDSHLFKQKVLTYSGTYIERLKSYYKLEINANDYIFKIKKLYDHILNN